MKPGCGMVALLAACCVSLGVTLRAEDKKKDEPPKVEIKAVSLEELVKYVAKQEGKPVAMDVWATWCVPCREKFPKFMALAAKHKDKASFFSLSIDEAEDIEKAKRFLESKKATFTNFLAKEGPEAVEKKFEFEGVPQYIAWDAKGKIALKTDDVAKLEEKLKEMLPEKKKKDE
jgi:thiol-disulfide isomerase/thioredoxin